MIKIVAKNILKEGKKAEFIKTAEELIQKSRAEEGNISYSLFEDVNNENIVAFIEEWKDLKAIEFHNNTEHFKRIVPMLGELREKSKVNLYKEI